MKPPVQAQGQREAIPTWHERMGGYPTAQMPGSKREQAMCAEITDLRAALAATQAAAPAEAKPCCEYWRDGKDAECVECGKPYAAAPSAPAAPVNESALLAAAREVLDTELGELASTGSMSPCEHALGKLQDAVNGAPVPAQGEREALRKLCDQLDGMRRTMFLRPGTGQNYSYLVHEDVQAYVEQARAALAAKVQPVAVRDLRFTLRPLLEALESPDREARLRNMDGAKIIRDAVAMLAAAPSQPAQQVPCRFDGNGCGAEGPYCAKCDLPAQQAGDAARDAARYRWLRERTVAWNALRSPEWKTGGKLDAAIDAAMAAPHQPDGA